MAEVCLADVRLVGARVRDDGVEWVAATPFRAHLAHVMAVGDMSVEVVAAMTGVPVGAARHLLSGRCGRPVRRISADTGRRLLRLTSDDARTVRQRLVPARAAAGQVRELLDDGYGLAGLAERSGVSEVMLAELAKGRTGTCSRFVAAQIAATYAAFDGRHRQAA